MVKQQRFPYTSVNRLHGVVGTLPRLPLRLAYADHFVDVVGIIDSGSTVCVLPYHIGLELGAVWEQQTRRVRLAGNLAAYEARTLVVDAYVGQLPVIRLAFAWTASVEPPLLLGQMNFFVALDICFYHSDFAFELTARSEQDE